MAPQGVIKSTWRDFCPTRSTRDRRL